MTDIKDRVEAYKKKWESRDSKALVNEVAVEQCLKLITDLAKDNEAKDKRINELYRKHFDTLEKIAPKLGFKPFGNTQVKWAKSQEDADKIKLGESVYKYVEQALNQGE